MSSSIENSHFIFERDKDLCFNDEIEVNMIYKEQNKAKCSYSNEKKSYKLLEEVNNGFKYFGQEKIIKNNRTCVFICPHCDETFRANLGGIINGSTKSCGCLRKRENR